MSNIKNKEEMLNSRTSKQNKNRQKKFKKIKQEMVNLQNFRKNSHRVKLYSKDYSRKWSKSTKSRIPQSRILKSLTPKSMNSK